MEPVLVRAASAFALMALAMEVGAANGTAQIAATATEAQRADAAARAALAEGPFAGIAIAVSHGGKIVYRNGFGFADVERQIPVTSDTRFPVGSITKPMTCLSVHQLAGAGRVDTNLPAGHYLPKLPAPARNVAIRHLLDHTSGIENYTEIREFPYRQPRHLSRDEMVALFAGRPLRFPPGDRFSYSNSNTYLLGLVVEEVSGVSYDAYVERHLFAPFGMTQTDFQAQPRGETNRARGYLSGDGRFMPAMDYDWLVPFSAGAAVSTAPDLLKFADGLFGERTPENVRQRLLTHQRIGDGSLNIYAQGCLVDGWLGDARQIGHSGSIYGFSSHFAHFPDRKLSIAVLTNSQGENFPAITLSNRIARIFLGQSEPDRTEQPLDVASIAWIEGDYQVGNRRIGVDHLGFLLRDGRLWMKTGSRGGDARAIPLVHLGDNRFVSSIDSEQLLRFEQSADGVSLIMDYRGGNMPFTRVKE